MHAHVLVVLNDSYIDYRDIKTTDRVETSTQEFNRIFMTAIACNVI